MSYLVKIPYDQFSRVSAQLSKTTQVIPRQPMRLRKTKVDEIGIKAKIRKKNLTDPSYVVSRQIFEPHYEKTNNVVSESPT